MQTVGNKYIICFFIQVGALFLYSCDFNRNSESELREVLNMTIQTAKDQNSLIFSYPNSVEIFEKTKESFGERELIVFNNSIQKNSDRVEVVFAQFRNCEIEFHSFNLKNRTYLSDYIDQPNKGKYEFVEIVKPSAITQIIDSKNSLIGIVSFKTPIKFICDEKEWLCINIEISGGLNYSSWTESYLFSKRKGEYELIENKKW